jgi:hypothetical protein
MHVRVIEPWYDGAAMQVNDLRHWATEGRNAGIIFGCHDLAILNSDGFDEHR